MKLIGTPAAPADVVEYFDRKGFKHLFAVIDVKPGSPTNGQVIKVGSVQSAMAFHMERIETTQLCRYEDLVAYAHKQQKEFEAKRKDEEKAKKVDTKTRTEAPTPIPEHTGERIVKSGAIGLDAETARRVVVQAMAETFESFSKALIEELSKFDRPGTNQPVNNKRAH